MENAPGEFKKTERLWQRVAMIAGAFSLIICVMIVVNFFQINRADPVNTLLMDKLVNRLQQDPSDESLREEIRALDLLARKAYFTNQWQIRTGGYLLLMGVAVVIISMQVILANRKKEPVLSDTLDEDFLLKQKNIRKLVSLGGSLVVITALVLAFLSHRDLEKKFSNAAIRVPAQEAAANEGTALQESATPGGNMDIKTDTVSEGEVTSAMKDGLLSGNDTPLPSESVPSVTGNPEPAAGNRFPNFRGPGGNGLCVQMNTPTDWDGATGKNIIWKTKVPLAGFNSPVIWDDRLFLTGANGNRREVYAMNRHTGEMLWTKVVTDVPGSPAQPPEVADYTGHAAPTVATDGDRVYAIFANGDIVALDMTGKMVWAKNLGVPVNHYGYSSSLIVYNNKVIVQYDQKNLARVIALSATSGEAVWTVQRNVKISWSSPVIVNTGKRMELLTTADPYIISYNPDTGEELWRIAGVTGEVGPSPAYADGVIFAVNDYSRLVAVKIGDQPEVLWEDEEYLSDVPSPVATKDYLFVATSYGMVVCYNTKTGEKFWEHEIDNTIYASPLIADGKVYLVDKQGITHIFKASGEFISIGTPGIGEKTVCTPAFAGNRIYLRGYDHLYCIGQ